jgi:carbamoyl-phosphate synthase large subunit
MPKRTDIQSILVLGAGPIKIGQACEFDYSGTQACIALKEAGYRVILVNSNPATIMTDPEFADATYIEPITPDVVANIIAREKPDALLPTMGGQTALNCALDLEKQGILALYNVEMIGAKQSAIELAEDRAQFQQAMTDIGLQVPRCGFAKTIAEAQQVVKVTGFPAIIRPCFTLGGAGGGIAYDAEELGEICTHGLQQSPTSTIMIDQSVIGWKEYELEVVRDRHDNCIIICSIENIDPMGVHTGDSITVAPALTLTDKEYQNLRQQALKILRKIGVDTGGANVQFAINPQTGETLVVEMNPRVSRSSALASKATGFPIAKIAAKLAIGYTLDELQNDITGGATPAAFEPTIDYIVTKIPRFNFEKFPNTDHYLTTQMKSVGEVMAFGRTFSESLQKAMRSLEIGSMGFEPVVKDHDLDTIAHKLMHPSADRLWVLGDAFRAGMDIDTVHRLTRINRWFLQQIHHLIEVESHISTLTLADLTAEKLRSYKAMGFADARLASLLGESEHHVREHRKAQGVIPVYKHIDSCAAEFPTPTAYLYACYASHDENPLHDSPKVIILGGGPNRIGQGIEFDYCCVHAAMALKEAGYQTIMVNCNPETVSTDYQITDKLYFEPLTIEDLDAIISAEKPDGVIIHYGGQTPLRLAKDLAHYCQAPIIGTTPDAIDRAEDRQRFNAVVEKLGLRQPESGIAHSLEAAHSIATRLGYPVMIRPSYVLGGRAMETLYQVEDLERYSAKVEYDALAFPLLIDRFLDNAIELDVDAIADGEAVFIAAIVEHIELAGVHSGDSSCCLPAPSIDKAMEARITEQVTAIAKELGVIGLMNVQFAIDNNQLYVLEVNPRASRTVPFISKAIGVDLAKVAAHCMVNGRLADFGLRERIIPPYHVVKKAVFPFEKFPGADPILGPEMRSTGEVIGIGETFPIAMAKAQMAAGQSMPQQGCVLMSVKDSDKQSIVEVAKHFYTHGFRLIATAGTAAAIQAADIPCLVVNKVGEGHPNLVDVITCGAVDCIINTTTDSSTIHDSYIIRQSAISQRVSYSTTVAGGLAMSISLAQSPLKVRALQHWHRDLI